MQRATIRLKCLVAYQGTHFAGWQLQPETHGRSVQGCLEKAFEQLTGTAIRVHGASRTDSGVHALGQCIHVDVPVSRAHIPWQRALNAILPKDVAVVSVERAPAGFHSRKAASLKTYTYTLWHEAGFVLPQRRAFVWAVGAADCAAMEDAAREFIGTHDFAAFQNAGTPVKNTVRTVRAILRRPGATVFESVWEVSGPGFLKQMVRNIMGCLVAVGRGKLNREDVRSVLANKDRSLAPATAPAKGLCLERMEFCDRERLEDQSGPAGDQPGLRPDQEGLGGTGGVGPRG